ncbi:DUF1217 domain-containing protein [Pseudodonghicola xiamenensis]|uniref:DUF1217 domain-containing protein n=1 Tax=Pseudodonghicola xiamenensis TaxID=337702 RepID=A0A8J3H6G2_9RHOB|nr:DUF1217 domain-containing protein [Pseudodonghicola xiamenensis]GHG85323.1 hypothetical protein GCM10010961_12300 [Pseudodonghicola xiamenensis]
MVISISGLNSPLALKLIDSTHDSQIETLSASGQHARAVSVFQERIGSITSPEDLVQDYEVYSFVMKAFDLESQIFGKAIIRKVLESDPSDSSSLVNRLTDDRFNDLNEALGFTAEGGEQVVPDFNDPDWQQGIIDKYFEQTLTNGYTEENENVGIALTFRNKVESIDNWYDVLKNKDLSNFFITALGLPTEMAAIDVDKQAQLLSKSYDLEKLSDPKEQDRLVTRFLAIADVQNPQTSNIKSAALTILQNSSSLNSSLIQLSWDIPSVRFSSYSLYR